MSVNTNKKITIVGNGFASLFFVQYFMASPVFPLFTGILRKLYSKYDITVIGNGRFVYFPSIPELIIGKKKKQDLIVDIRPFLKRRNIRFIEGKITDITDDGRTVIVNGEAYKNDALFLGIGPEFLKGDIRGTKQHTFSPCYGPDDMEVFLQRLAAMDKGIIYLGFKINKEDGFVAGRGGQMYECACLLDYALKKRGVRERFEIHFFSTDLSPDDTGMITDSMQARGIILDYGYEPAEFVEGGMLDSDGSFRKADLIMYSPGITAPKLAQESCLPVTQGGHIDVDQFGQVRGLEHVFASGDCASHDSPPKWVPHQAHMAQLRSQGAARNMHSVLNKAEPSATYRYELSCILNMENDALWLHMSSDNRSPFWNLFPRHSKKLIQVKKLFERLYLFYLRYL